VLNKVCFYKKKIIIIIFIIIIIIIIIVELNKKGMMVLFRQKRSSQKILKIAVRQTMCGMCLEGKKLLRAMQLQTHFG